MAIERSGPPSPLAPSPTPATAGTGLSGVAAGAVATGPVAGGLGRAHEDRDLLHRLRRGDEAALSLLYDRYSGVVLALLLRIVGSRPEAEDLLQEVFLQAWRRAPEYDPQRGSFATWIFTIARNRALDVVRSPRHKSMMSEQAGAAVVAKPTAENKPEGALATPEESVAMKQRVQAVRLALSELSGVQREAIELAYYGGLSHSEIASQTGEPLGTVKSRINQAAARLRSALQQIGGRP